MLNKSRNMQKHKIITNNTKALPFMFSPNFDDIS